MGKSGDNAIAGQTNANSQGLFNEAQPFTSDVFGQGEQLLKGGSASMLIPLISKAIESSKLALSKTMTDLRGRMGRLAGTPFGQQTEATTQLTGEQGIANVAPSMSMDLFKSILGFTSNQNATAVGGMSSAGQAQATTQASANDAFARIMSAALPHTNFNFSSGGGGGGGG